jgi:hypothetical protein
MVQLVGNPDSPAASRFFTDSGKPDSHPCFLAIEMMRFMMARGLAARPTLDQAAATSTGLAMGKD